MEPKLTRAIVFLWIFSCMAMASRALAEEKVFELRLFNSPFGTMRTKEFTLEENGRSRPAASVNMEVTLNRLGEGVSIGMDQLEVFDDEGKLLRFRSEIRSSVMPQVTEGRIENGQCVIKTNGREQTIPWDPATVTEKQLEKDFKELIQRPVGSSVSHKIFIPDFMKSVETTTTLLGTESRATRFGQKDLHKIRTTMDIGTKIVTHSWVDGEGEPFEQEVALGPFMMQAIRISADEPVAVNDSPPDVFQPMILRLEKPLKRPERVQSAIYRLQFKNGNKNSFYNDTHQRVLSDDGKVVRLQVEPRAPARPVDLNRRPTSAEAKPYLQATSFAQSDDPMVLQTARSIVKGETDAWRAAKKLESWVHDNLGEKNLSVAFASASETLKTREGDCTEHATLLVALLRAVGLPARAAEGLVYAESINGFGYHMWSEVLIDGVWYDLDATRPASMVDATHIQMGSSDLGHGAAGEMASHILQYLGQFDIEVESTH